MNEYMEFSAKTVYDCITESCQKFVVTSDKLEYEVVTEGSTGFLGIGNKPAKIQAKVKEVEVKPLTIEEICVEFLEKVFAAMNLVVKVDVQVDEKEEEVWHERKIHICTERCMF